MSFRRPVLSTNPRPWPALVLGLVCLDLSSLPVQAAESEKNPTSTSPAVISSLEQALELAWPRHPAARTASSAQALITQQNEAAERWLAAPPSLQLSHRSDAWSGGSQGSRENEAALELPLRWPAERQAERRSAEAQGQRGPGAGSRRKNRSS